MFFSFFLNQQCDELLRPGFLQEILDHTEERRLHRWCLQVQAHQMPPNRLVKAKLSEETQIL